ncbi:hypothetical protein GCM10011517_29460 [Actibacterium pelagium]|uniref:Uncharacterized protein n=1 Tax=Actibacterium pelagium TaxID=2029103 RepID=A0A917ALZ6_9RHOB|nr:hypothetical protein GCM10011517_29460 [Actibacterium pelagium]
MDGKGKAFGQVTQLRQRAAAHSHVILGVDFQPVDGTRILHDRAEMLRFVAYAGAIGQLFKAVGKSVKHRKAFG